MCLLLTHFAITAWQISVQQSKLYGDVVRRFCDDCSVSNGLDAFQIGYVSDGKHVHMVPWRSMASPRSFHSTGMQNAFSQMPSALKCKVRLCLRRWMVVLLSKSEKLGQVGLSSQIYEAQWLELGALLESFVSCLLSQGRKGIQGTQRDHRDILRHCKPCQCDLRQGCSAMPEALKSIS